MVASKKLEPVREYMRRIWSHVEYGNRHARTKHERTRPLHLLTYAVRYSDGAVPFQLISSDRPDRAEWDRNPFRVVDEIIADAIRRAKRGASSNPGPYSLRGTDRISVCIGPTWEMSWGGVELFSCTIDAWKHFHSTEAMTIETISFLKRR